MEYVQGETLRERLTEGPLPVRNALETAGEIAEALEAAHKQNIVHRDLKPSNIMLTPEGHVKVMDFGLAKRVTPAEGQEEEITTKLTKDDSFLGTVPYMSPEQLRGQEVDARSDIFSFGVVLYEMLAGVHPFKKGGQIETANAVLSETAAPLSRYTNDISGLLQHTIKKMLAKESDRRYQLIHDVRTNLGELISDIADSSTRQAGIDSFAATARETGAPVVARSWPQMVPWSIAVVVTLIAGISIWNLMRPVPLLLTKSVITPAANAPLANSPNTGVAISPDGRKIVYPAIVDGTSQLYVRDLDNLIATPLPGTEGAVQPFFSPDGRSVAFFAADKLAKASLTGTLAVTLCDAPRFRGGGSWGTEDTIVFASNNGRALYRVSAGGGEPEVLLTPDEGESYWFPHLLPGGKAVLFTVWDGGEGHQVAAALLETGEKRILIEGGSQPYYASTGHLAYYRPFTGTLMAVPFEPEGLEVIGEAIPVQEGIRTNTHNLVWVDRQGTETLVTDEERDFRAPRISPDEKQVAFTIGVPAIGAQIWIYDIPTDSFSRLTFEEQRSGSAAWSPDSKWLIFQSGEPGEGGMVRQPADGSLPPERLTSTPSRQQPNSWSSDGQFLAFIEGTSSVTGTFDIGIFPLEGEEPDYIVATQAMECCPKFSPDGKWIAYVSDESGRIQVYVRPFQGPDVKWLISVEDEGGGQPVWSPDGTELFYRSGDKMMVVSVQTKDQTLEAGTPSVLFEGRYVSHSNPPGFQYYDIAPDGKRFLMLKEESTQGQNQINVVLNWFEELKRLVPTN
jgi:serine/threonine-protein kinase